METFAAIRTALAVRQYQDVLIPAETIRRIVEAGWLTGSARNSQPWHFIVVEDRATIRRLGELAPTGRYTSQAPLVIVVAVEQGRFAVSDGSRAVQSMILAAWAEGVGSNWVGFTGMDEVKTLLGIPEELDTLAVLPFGYPVKELGKGKKKRKPLQEVVSRERFGQPYKVDS
jgi:nitroreductase